MKISLQAYSNKFIGKCHGIFDVHYHGLFFRTIIMLGIFAQQILLLTTRKGMDGLFELMAQSKTVVGVLLLIVIYVCYKIFFRVEKVDTDKNIVMLKENDNNQIENFSKENALDLLRRGEINTCLKALDYIFRQGHKQFSEQLTNELIILTNRWNMLNNDLNNNLIIEDKYEVEKNKLVRATLNFINNLNEEDF